jgi:hypothetical protein
LLLRLFIFLTGVFMKKSTLALSVIAALGGMGFASSALAIGALSGATATSLVVNPDGIGHQLVIPYFTVQGDNATLINITNTDLVNGKLVKVRFRGAANSDDLFDFQVLMSPGDVWTASLSQDATSKVARLKTVDKTCVLPAFVSDPAGNTFVTSRVDPTPVKGDKANETREGYIEILNMADIPPSAGATDLFPAIKHVKGVAPCTAAVLEAQLGTDVATAAAAVGRGLTPPSGGLTSDWIILNQANTAAWSGSATALEARIGAARALGNVAFWPQKFGTPLLGAAATADPLLVVGAVAGSGNQDMQQYDLPDLSTPYIVGDTTPVVRAEATAASLAVSSVTNQYVTTTDINSVTDLLFSQPTRRYAVALNYVTNTAVRSTALTHYSAANTAITNRQICLTTLTSPTSLNLLFDREETTPGTTGTTFVISPNDPVTPTAFRLCGETAVFSINAGATTSALSATVNRGDISFADASFKNGWLRIATPGAAAPGLPILGGSFIRASNGSVNYGFLWNHKTTR